jgi:competence protein ComEA
MVLTRLEKVAFVGLVAMLGLGIFLFIGRLGMLSQTNTKLRAQVAQIAGLTDQTVLIKDDKAVSADVNARKLNLNKASDISIAALPAMNSPLAKRIVAFIKKRGGIKNMSELLEVKGMSRNKLRTLELYATTWGGHAGQAAWGDKLNLNFATQQELEVLPGIGKKTAREIINFRNRNGGFFSLNELKEIPGLTPQKIEKFVDRLEVR